MITIRFADAFPSALRAEVAELLAPLLSLVDLHLDTIVVALKSAGDVEGEAAILVKRQYHVAHLYIDAAFFELQEHEKERTLLHELLHVLVDVYAQETEAIAQEFVPEAVLSYVYRRLAYAEETLVNALAISFTRLHEGLTIEREVAKLNSEAFKASFKEAIEA